MRRTALGLALALTAALAGTAAPVGPAEAATHGSTVHPHGTFLVGDSTTYRVAGLLREVAPDWYLDYHRGRSIKALPHHIRRYLAKDADPSNFVMALGTNWTHDPEWSEARLRRAIGLLPRDTNVFLLLVVRAGAFQAEKDATLRLYDEYSRDLARTRPHTYVVDWRGTVLSDPTLDPVKGTSSLIEDGTHETGSPHSDHRGPGMDTWVSLVVSRWEAVNGVQLPGAAQLPAVRTAARR